MNALGDKVLQKKRQLFHSFPRPRSGEDPADTLSRGLAILEFMKEAGLVLAPEIVEWDLSVLLRKQEHVRVLQRRACFTELSLEELPNHASVFGPISLSFDIDKLRASGATPVIYIPQGQGESILSHLGAFCVYCTNATHYVLRQLQQLKELSDPKIVEARENKPVDPNYTLNLINTGPDASVVAEYIVPAQHARNLLAYVGFNNIPFDHSAAVLRVFLSMFYPTDNLHAADTLGYYRQREWRVISTDIAFNNHPATRALTRTEQERLLSIDREFWSRELTHENALLPRHAFAQIYSPLPAWSVFDLVDAIIAPENYHEKVRSIVGSAIKILPL